MNKKPQFIILGVVILLLFFGGLYFYYQKNKNKVFIPEPTQPEEVENTTIEQVEPTGEGTPEEVITDNLPEDIRNNNALYEKAMAQENKSFCLQMTKEYTRNICLKLLAEKMLDSSICADISDETMKVECQKGTIVSMAEKENDPLECAKLLEETDQTACIRRLVLPGFPLESCFNIPLKYDPRTPVNIEKIELRDLCTSLVYFYEAMADSDLEACNKVFLREYRADCLSKILSIPLDSDADKDGLSYRAEIIFGTDPDKADSDGDGYLDKDEIEKRYNPIGQGVYIKKYFDKAYQN